MPIRVTIVRLGLSVKALLPCFHKSHLQNLVFMIVGMAYSRSVSLPRIANHVPIGSTQIESRVQRFERLLDCDKFVPLDMLKPVAKELLQKMCRNNKEIMILMDRSMINDTLNLLYVAVAFGRRAIALGWVVVPHEGNSDLKLQKRLLGWLKECLPVEAEPFIVADREFHSIHLAHFIREDLQSHFVLRIKAGTWIWVDGGWIKAGELASKGEGHLFRKVKVTRDRKVKWVVNLLTLWGENQDEPWLLISDLEEEEKIEESYKGRYWIEEMFSDHKSRGLNLEVTRITDPDRLERLLVAVVLCYIWIMEIGALVVSRGEWRRVDNRGAKRSVSLCQIGLRWLKEMLIQGVVPPILTCNFRPVGDT